MVCGIGRGLCPTGLASLCLLAFLLLMQISIGSAQDTLATASRGINIQSSISTSSKVTSVSRFPPFGPVSPLPGYRLDPDCLLKLANRQVPDGDHPLPCPCCVPDGTAPLTYSTVSRPDRPPSTATDTSGWTYDYHDRVTVSGSPNPTESSSPVASPTGCGRRRDVLPSTQSQALKPRQDAPEDIFRDQLTTPGNGENGTWNEADWWSRMQGVVLSSGATLGEDIESGDHYWADDAAFTEHGDTGTGGGIAPLWGCVGVVVASSRGVYLARLWENPTFSGPDAYDLQTDADLYRNPAQIYMRRVRGLLVNGTKVSDDGHVMPSLSSLKDEFFPESHNFTANDRNTWRKVLILTPEGSTSPNITASNALGWLRADLAAILGYPEESIMTITYPREDRPEDETEEFYLERPGKHLLAYQFAPKQTPVSPASADSASVNALRIWWDQKVVFYKEWCADGHCACKSRPDEPFEDSGELDDTQSGEVDFCPEESPNNSTSGVKDKLRRRQTGGTPSGSGTSANILQNSLTDPLTWLHGANPVSSDQRQDREREEHWWARMREVVRRFGANAGMHLRGVDDFAPPHSTFQPFGSQPVGSGVMPLFGCTGILVVTNHGIYAAHLWEMPDFRYVADERDHGPAEFYDWEQVLERRIRRLFERSFPARPGSGGRATRSLTSLAGSNGPFNPQNRQWIRVIIFTPDENLFEATRTPAFPDRIDHVAELLATILQTDQTEMEVAPYAVDPFRQLPEDATTEYRLQYFESMPGINMPAVQYAPAHREEGDGAPQRAVRLWFNRNHVFERFWVLPSGGGEEASSGEGGDGGSCPAGFGGSNATATSTLSTSSLASSVLSASGSFGAPRMPVSSSRPSGSFGSSRLPVSSGSSNSSSPLASGVSTGSTSSSSFPTSASASGSFGVSGSVALSASSTATSSSSLESSSSAASSPSASTSVSELITVTITGWHPPPASPTNQPPSSSSPSTSLPPKKNRMCLLSFTPRIFPNNETPFALNLTSLSIDIFTYDESQGLSTSNTGPNSRHLYYNLLRNLEQDAFWAQMGDAVFLSRDETGLGEDLVVQLFGHSWEEYLWLEGYECGIEKYFEPACCRTGKCDDVWRCNCPDPDSNSPLCWPKKTANLPQCCLARDGCQSPKTYDLGRMAYRPSFPFWDERYFPHQFRYGNVRWDSVSSRKEGDEPDGTFPVTIRVTDYRLGWGSWDGQWRASDAEAVEGGYDFREDGDLHWERNLRTYFWC